MRTDILEKYGIDPATIKTTDDLDGMFETIHAGEPDMAMMRLEGSGTFVYADYDPLGDTFGVLLNYGQDDEISDLFSSDKFRAECEKHREWFKKGWIASDILTTPLPSVGNKTFCRSGPFPHRRSLLRFLTLVYPFFALSR